MYLREAIEKALSILNQGNINNSKPLTSHFSFERNAGGINCPDRTIVLFQGIGKGKDCEISISMRGFNQHRDVTYTKAITLEGELISVIEEWREAVYWWQSRISFYRLEVGREYKITRSFTDLDGQKYKEGTNFMLLSKSVFAKEDGYTLKTNLGVIRLQGQINSEILENLDLYINEGNYA